MIVEMIRSNTTNNLKEVGKYQGSRALFNFLKHEFERHLLVVSVVDEEGDEVDTRMHS